MKKIHLERVRHGELKRCTAVDMHVHSNHSHDSITRVDALVKRAKKLGITFALTDHDQISGCEEISRRFPDFFFIPGIEVRSDLGFHTLLYFHTLADLQDYYKRHVEPYKKKHNYPSAHDQIRWAKKYGAISSMAHPFAPGMTAIMTHRKKIERALLRAYDCVEVIQGSNIPGRNHPAIDLAHELGSGITAGSDAHLAIEMGETVTIAEGELSVSEFLHALRYKQVLVRGKARWSVTIGVSHALKTMGPLRQSSYYAMRAKEKVSRMLRKR